MISLKMNALYMSEYISEIKKMKIFAKKVKKNLEFNFFVVPLQSQNKQSGGGEMVDTLL